MKDTQYIKNFRKKNLKFFIVKVIRKLLMFLNIKEYIIIYKLRKNKKLFYIKELKEYFDGSDVFSFGTGGSVDNINDFDRLKNKNTLFLTTGPLYCYHKYGFMPNMWFVHNPPSVEVLINEAIKMKLDQELDFSNTFIFVPSNLSNSKNIEFSSKVFKKFRKMINNNAIFVLYDENFKGYLANDNNINNYLDNSYPIIPMMGSSVENIFLPFLHFIGVRNIYFSGVDHMDTGHFWDRNNYYGKAMGKKLNFQDIQSNQYIFECGEIARKRAKEVDVNIYRLESDETILQDYEFIEFEKVLQISTEKVVL
jgi:hypothetical protein